MLPGPPAVEDNWSLPTWTGDTWYYEHKQEQYPCLVVTASTTGETIDPRPQQFYTVNVCGKTKWSYLRGTNIIYIVREENIPPYGEMATEEQKRLWAHNTSIINSVLSIPSPPLRYMKGWLTHPEKLWPYFSRGWMHPLNPLHTLLTWHFAI